MTNKERTIPQTKEQMEYENAKKNFRVATAKERLRSSGIDLSKVSQQAIDNVMRIFDDMESIQQDTQQKTSKVQQDADAKIQRLNQDANKKFGEVQKRYQDLMNSLMGVKGDIHQVDAQEKVETRPDVQEVSAKEEVVERTREDIVSDITEKLLNTFMPFMKGPVSEKVNEFLSTIDKKTNDIVAKVPDDEQVIVSAEDVKAEKAVQTEKVEKIVQTEKVEKTVSAEELRQAIYKDIL